MLRLARTWLMATGVPSGTQYESFQVNNTWVVRQNLPAPSSFNACACSVAFNCPDSSWRGGQFFCQNGNNCTAGTVVWSVPGFVKGCSTLEQIFGTDLRCFYNQTCFDIVLSMYNVDMPNRLSLPQSTYAINVLNSSIPSKFLPNDTIDILFNALMLEQWIIESNFDGYYETCAPSTCTYTVVSRLDLVYVASTLVGLIGGLSVAFRLIIPPMIHISHLLILKWLQRRSNPSHQRTGN